MAVTLDYTDKNVIGNAAWKVLHAFTTQYPDSPTSDDKKEFHSLVKSVLRTIPDDECRCRTHAVEYIQKKPPKMGNKKELIQWLCDFHNDVNKRLGKHEFDCKLLTEPKVCKTCTPKVKPLQVIQDKDSGIKEAMGNYKQLSIKVFEELCKRENLPMPQIVFAPCPTAQHTSCTTLVVKKYSQEVNKNQTPVVYINPANFGLRVLVHEETHYVKKMKGENALNEDEVERHTQDIIQKYFPADSYDENTKTLIQPLVMKDAMTVGHVTAKPTVEPLHPYNKGFNPKRFREAVPESFPMFAKYRDKHRGNKAETLDGDNYEGELEAPTAKGGLLSYFDGLYEPVAKVLHISARELNLANTPNIFAEGTKLIMNTQLTPIGSILTSTLLGIAMYVVTGINREGLGLEDRRLFAQLGGQFLWTGLQYANNPALKSDAIAVGNTLATWDIESIKPLLLKSFQTEAQEIQQGGVQARSQQRGSGSSGGTVGVTGISQRNTQRSSGIDTRPEGAGIYKNFGSGASASGVAVPKATEGGGLGFTYVPNINRTGLSPEEKEMLENEGQPVDALYYDNPDDFV